MVGTGIGGGIRYAGGRIVRCGKDDVEVDGMGGGSGGGIGVGR